MDDAEQRELEIGRLRELRHKGGLGFISAIDKRPHELSPEEYREYQKLQKLYPD